MASSGLSSDIPPRPYNGEENRTTGGGESSGTLLPQQHVEFTAQATEPGSPPTYDEAMNPSGLPPPSYDSLFGRVREVHKESSGTVDFLKNVILLLAGTIGCTIMIGVTIVIPVSMLVIGSVYFKDCTISYRIPLYLVVGGAFGVLKQVFHLVKRCSKCFKQRTEEQEEKTSTFQNGLACFMLAWFILGSYWVYKEFQPNYDPALGPYCNKTLYLFAFWQITSIYITLIMTSLCMCMVSLVAIGFARKHVQSSSPS